MTHWRRALALLLILFARPAAAQSGHFVDTTTPVSPAGVRAVIDAPADLHMKNVGGSDGAGLCVFTSMQLAARWQYIPEMEGFQDYMRKRPGGGYPTKVTKVMTDFCREKNVTVPYVQHTGGDVTFLELAYRTRRSPSVTYDGRDNFYRNSVAHMVTGAHLDGSTAAIIDNNRPGKWTWMSRQDFLDRWKAKGGGWAVVFLGPPPPPNPDGTDPAPLPGPSPSPTPPAPLPGPSPCPGPGPCPTPGPRPRPCPGPGPCPHGVDDTDGFPVIGEPGYQWQYVRDGVWWLWKGDRFLGEVRPDGWHPQTRGDNVTVSPAGDPPVAPPVGGVDFSEVGTPGVYRYWVGGVEVSQAEAYAALVGSVPDDSGHYYLSAVGPVGGAAAALKVALATPAGGLLAGKAHARPFPPESWVARRLKPGLTFQAPAPKGGAVLWQGADPADPALANAIRKALDPNWTPPPAPTPPAPGPNPSPVPQPIRPPLPLPPVDFPTGPQVATLFGLAYLGRRLSQSVHTLRSQTR